MVMALCGVCHGGLMREAPCATVRRMASSPCTPRRRRDATAQYADLGVPYCRHGHPTPPVPLALAAPPPRPPAHPGHVVVEDRFLADSDRTLNRIKEMLEERFGICHTTIQMESERYEEIGEVHPPQARSI